jgi:hypothetical protein
MTERKHKHHILPKHMGGGDEKENIRELTISEHAETHKKLYLEHGKIEDKIAWLSLSQQMDFSDLKFELAKLGGTKNKGKLFWYNEITKEAKKCREKPEGEGWENRRSPKFKSKITEYSYDNTGHIWCHDPENVKNTKLVPCIDAIPSGWVAGRHETNMFKTEGYLWYHDPETSDEKTFLNHPGGNWQVGMHPKHKSAVVFQEGNVYSNNRLGSKWYHDPNDPSKTKMINSSEPIPADWKKGRAPKK